MLQGMEILHLDAISQAPFLPVVPYGAPEEEQLHPRNRKRPVPRRKPLTNSKEIP
jgi:hypothetical protein